MTTVSLVESIKHTMMGFSMAAIIRAILIAILGYIIYRLAKKGIKAIFERNKVQPRAQQLIMRAFNTVYLIAIFIIIISELGVDTSSLLVLLAICLLVFVFAAEDILGNTASGIVMASTNPFKKGDIVVIDGMEGIVIDIRVNCTKIKCYDGEVVTIPNKKIATSKVINYSTEAERRVVVKFVASYKEEPQKVIDACTEMLNNAEGVLHSIAPRVFISEYKESNIEYSIYFWTKPEERLLRKLEITTRLYEVFKEAGIEINYPQIRLSEESVFGKDDLNNQKGVQNG